MLFKDQSLSDELRNNGYVVIPFLNPADILKLNEFYSTLHNGDDPPNFTEDIHMTTWCSDSEYKKKVSSGLSDIFTGASDRFFQNYRRLNNVFIVKKSGKQTTFKVHQDWNVVDETKHESVNVWVPLHDVNEQSGALWVLKKSHKIGRHIRGSGYLFPEYGPHLQALQDKAISVKLKAGEAIVFYHSVIHGSPPNMASFNRKAACFTVLQKETPLCIYYQPSAGEPLKQYEPDDDFIYNYANLRRDSTTQPPAEQPVKTVRSYENKAVELKELLPFLKEKKRWFDIFRS
ncbi:hypothetical protein CNR22_03995 [Sphingobacteriaceae bacterium]|nr:hypothetical protein CNR22_03995 [Sphingobacteriaceae bacterium]